MTETLKLLQVEDSKSDAELIVRCLNKAGYEVDWTRVESAEAMRLALERRPWDLVVSDYKLPGFLAPEALQILKKTELDIPFIVVSGTIGEEPAVALMKSGASDYLMKDNLARLPAAVERELREAKAREESRRTTAQLKRSEDRLALALTATDTGTWEYDFASNSFAWSELTRKHLGMGEVKAKSLPDFFDLIHELDRNKVMEGVYRSVDPDSGGFYEKQYRVRTPEHLEQRWVSGWSRVIFDETGRPVRALGVTRDITKQKQVEESLEFQLHLTGCIALQTTDCILVADGDGRVRFLNPAAEKTFGFKLAEYENRGFDEVLCPEAGEESILGRAIRHGKLLHDKEETVFDKDGRAIEVSVSCAPLRLQGVGSGMVFTFRDIRERKRAEQAVRESDARLRQLFESDLIGFIVIDGMRILEANDYFLRMLGYTREEFTRGEVTWKNITAPESTEHSQERIYELLATGICRAFEKEYIHRSGRRVPVVLGSVRLKGPGELRAMSFILDLTEKKELEKQFRQAQKLETVGQLAGGIAHDFNNLLTVIMGYSAMLMDSAEEDPELADPLRQISQAAERAAGLTRQLLMFSRQNRGNPANVRLDAVVAGVEPMIRRLIGEDIRFAVRAVEPGGVTRADQGLLEQVIVNFAVNARDAMPNGGCLGIETGTATMSGGDPLWPEVPQGNYCTLTVMDTGTGMKPEVQARLFEPFFTTKEPGKGTGLGLAVVYGIVKQYAGFIRVESAPGSGTAMRVLLPAVTELPEEQKATEARPTLTGAETVMVVEDEPEVRRFITGLLRAHGYRALEAGTGAEAMELANRHTGEIDILLTDLVLPGMATADLIAGFRVLRPEAKIVSMSGYPERHDRKLSCDVPHLQKPFTAAGLLGKIREVLA